MIETQAVQQILNDEFNRAKHSNPSYSLRAFARRLKVSPATLSLLLNGRRPASKRFAVSLTKTLSLDPKQSAELLNLFRLKSSRSEEQVDHLRLEADQFHVISDWYYFAILSLLETKETKSAPEWFARRLGIPVLAAKTALERLERLDLIKRDAKKFRLTGRQLTTSDEIASSAIQKNHGQMLDQAKSSLQNDPLELRDFLSITMAIDPAKIPQAKALMREFRQKMCSYLESGEKVEVYALALQLIPLSNSKGSL